MDNLLNCLNKEGFENLKQTYMKSSNEYFDEDTKIRGFETKFKNEYIWLAKQIYNCSLTGKKEFSAVHMTRFGLEIIPKVTEVFTATFADLGIQLTYLKFGSFQPLWFVEWNSNTKFFEIINNDNSLFYMNLITCKN